MRTMLFLVSLFLCCPTGEAQQEAQTVREYFIASVEIGWDYIHVDSGDQRSEQSRRFKANPQKYIKAVYREYTDATFTVPKPRPAWTGIQGPVIVGLAGNRVVVHFKNLASQPYSISPVGITYWKQFEGAGYDDSTAGQEKEDDAVPPGGYYEYVWDISTKDGPTISDPDCLTYSYSSQVDTVRDMNSGLMGALLICKPSAFTEDGQRKFQAFVLLFAVFDETKSWYGEVGERMSKERFRRSDGRKEYHTINGYVNSTLPGLTLCQGRNPVSWHMIGLGSTPEIHSIRFQDHTLEVLNHRKVTVEVTPMTFVTAEMRPASLGQFLISCQIHSHHYDGMNALFSVEKCPDPVIKDVRNVKEDDNNKGAEDGSDENSDYKYYTYKFIPKKPQAVGRSSGGQLFRKWYYFIAAEEVTWNYAPHLKPTDSELQSRYLTESPHHLGYTYKKVVYVEYTDASFNKRKSKTEYLQGPILKGRVNDEIHIVFRNLASRPFNIYPNGLTKIIQVAGTANAIVYNPQSLGVPPNKTAKYIWMITSDDGPLEGDPQCLTHLYQSTISPEQDLASGLVGTLLICKSDAFDTTGNLRDPDEKPSLIFAVFDENKSWYFKENMKRSTRSSYNITDPEFYESNVIYSINGLIFGGRKFVMCHTDVPFWHVANVGTRSEFLSVYFTGNLFQYQGIYQSVLTLFPMTAITIPMVTDVIGEWEISAFDSSLRSRGMSISYTVRPCNDFPLVDRDEDEDITDYIDNHLQPRGLRPQNGTVLVRRCNTTGQNVNLGKDAHTLCHLTRVPAAAVKEEELPTDAGIPEDVLEKLKRDGGWTGSENQAEAGENRSGRRKREVGGNWTENTDTPPNSATTAIQTFPSEDLISPEEDMEENYIYLESEALSDEQSDLEYNYTDGTTHVNLSFDYDDYNDAQVNGSTETFDTVLVGPRSGETKPRHYYIAAEEITWDYGITTPYQHINPREMRRGMRKFLPKYRKVVYRAYRDKDFKHPIQRGELEEHLGIMGPVIRTEVHDLLTVVFKNNANRPYSFHLHGVYDRSHSSSSSDVSGEPVLPGQARTYSWKIQEQQGPSVPEFKCKTGAYYSTVDKEKDLHSGLIGPLVICKPGTLQNQQNPQPDIQDFSLLFHTFDESKSWYHAENLVRYCTPPCQVNTEDPWYHTSNKFAAINGYVAETLPGLIVAKYQPVRWHLLNVGDDKEYHAVHFHGLPFTVHAEKEHRMGVFNLFPGVFGTVEMSPPTVGTWLVECTIGDYQLAGMRAKLLVYDPKCVLPLGMKSGRIKDSQITAKDHSDKWEPRLARIDMTGFYNAWMPKGIKSWLQVDLLRPTLLHSIQTQGASSKLRNHYTSLFEVSYSLNQETWTTYIANSTSTIKPFHGYLDSSKVKENSFTPPFVARYVRIHPTKNSQKPALRLELLGCDLNSCSLPLGLEKRIIPDTSFDASSSYSFLRSWNPSLARLHQSGGANAWRPKNNNPHEWLQVDLGKVKRITGVITQGARSILTQMMVTEYSVTFSQDRHSWSSVLDGSSQRDKIFAGNSDPEEEAFTEFVPPLFARYLRIHPRGWVNDIALRLEVLGCDTQRGL